MVIIDAKIDYKEFKLLKIHDDGTIDEVNCINPYFYVLVPRNKLRYVNAILKTESIGLEPLLNYKAVVWNGEKYVVDRRYVPVKVICESPTQVPKIANNLFEMGLKIGYHNIRFIVRNCFDLDVRFFDTIPLYYTFDTSIIDNIEKVKGLVIDVEVIDNEPRIVSYYEYRPLQDVEKDNVGTLELPKQFDDLIDLFNKHTLIMGHNIVGFDIPVLERQGLVINKMIKVLFDTSVVLSTHSPSLQVGSARSLYDVSVVLKDKANITDEEINIKKTMGWRLRSLSLDELIRYNINDVVLTAKILNIIFPFCAIVSAYSQIPLTEITSLPAGMVAEYMLARYCELLGYIPEYRPTQAKLVGERVYLEREGQVYKNVLQTDIVMMYPSFVLHELIDPTLIVSKNKFDRKAGIGLLYSLLKRLYNVRLMTKKLKKTDKRFSPVDAGVKAILNALAYGVQGKMSGFAIMGNPICPSRIFYGTRNIQFSLIDYLRKHEIRCIYSDTDSFFIQLEGQRPEDIVQIINSYLKTYGLEVDVEDIWDSVFVYRKKNYVLRKGDLIIVKGSALRNLTKFYLPSCISLIELMKLESSEERRKYIKEVIESCDLQDLFVHASQQVWRLISKDIQSFKRLREKRERYIKALTVWNELPYVILKKAHISQFLMPHSAPILRFVENGSNRVELSGVNPFEILEIHVITLRDYLERLKGVIGNYDCIAYLDDLYAIKVEGLYYILSSNGKEIRLPCKYEKSYFKYRLPTLIALEIVGKKEKIKIDEEILRNIMFKYTLNILKEYGLI